MKVIASINGDKFLVEASETELVNLAGFRWTSDKQAPKIRVGTELQVSPAFSQLETLAANRSKVKKIVKEIRGIADDFEQSYRPVIVPEMIQK